MKMVKKVRYLEVYSNEGFKGTLHVNIADTNSKMEGTVAKCY